MKVLNKKITDLYIRNRKKYNYIINNLVKNNLSKILEFKISKKGWIIFECVDIVTYHYLINEINVSYDYKQFNNEIDYILLIPLKYQAEYFNKLKEKIQKNDYISNYERYDLNKNINYYLELCSSTNKKE